MNGIIGDDHPAGSDGCSHRPRPSSSTPPRIQLAATEVELDAFSDTVRHLWCPPGSTRMMTTTSTISTAELEGGRTDDNAKADRDGNDQTNRNGIPILSKPPTALQFSRDFVGPNRPCIIRNVILNTHHHRPIRSNSNANCRDGDHDGDNDDDTDETRSASTSPVDGGEINDEPLYLDLDQICNLLPVHETMLTVDVTPDGHGDCVRTVAAASPQVSSTFHQQVFVQPKECPMSLFEFRSRLRNQDESQQQQQGYPYRSHIGDESGHSAHVDVNNRPIVHMMDPVDPGLQHEQQPNRQGPVLPGDSVVYYSRQNDCLRDGQEGISALQSLFPSNFSWAQQAFFFGDTYHDNGSNGNSKNSNNIDAVNLWIGNDQAVSSMHKDHYENLMYVASGEKIFTLCPPSDVIFLYEHLQYEPCVFEVTDTGNINRKNNVVIDGNHDSIVGSGARWVIQKGQQNENGDNNKVRWIAPNVSILLHGTTEQRNALLQAYPLLRYAHPIEVKVRAGELLYLPKLWYHRVTQSCETVAVNYWYEMAFECSPLWCYYEFLQQLRHTPHEDDDGT